MDDHITAVVSGAFATAAILAMIYLTEIIAGYRVLVYRLLAGL